MSKMKRKVFFHLYCFCLILSVLLTGCNRMKVIDQVQIISVLGFDKKEEKFIGNAIYADFTEQKQGKINSLQAEAEKGRLVLMKLNEQSQKPIQIGKLNVLIFSKDLAENDISHFLKTFCRDPLINTNLIIAVSEEPPEEILNTLTNKDSDYLHNLIKQNFDSGNLPFSNLQLVLFDFYGEGRDVAVPYIRLNEKGNVQVKEFAVFKNNKLSLLLDRQEMLYFKLLQGKSITGDITGDMAFKVRKGEKKDKAVFSILYGKSHSSVTYLDSTQRITCKIILHGMVKEYPDWLDLKKTKDFELMTDQLEKQMKNDFSKLLVKLQEQGTDPLGIGDLVRAHSRTWDKKDFYETEYKNLKFDINVEINLHRSGIGE